VTIHSSSHSIQHYSGAKVKKKTQNTSRGTPKALDKELVSSGCDFKAAMATGTAYLTLTWYLFHLILQQRNPAIAGGLASLGTASQMAFLLLFGKQRSLRAKLLGLPQKLPLFRDHDDVPMTTYDVLLLLVFIAAAAFLLINCMSQHQVGPLHPLW
jgi:hypothetical protein